MRIPTNRSLRVLSIIHKYGGPINMATLLALLKRPRKIVGCLVRVIIGAKYVLLRIQKG